jgi:hypothetical protein
MREQMVLDEKVIGVELSASKKQFKWPVKDTDKKTKENDEEDNESNDEMSALQKIFVVHSVCFGNEHCAQIFFFHFRLFWVLVQNPINEIWYI